MYQIGIDIGGTNVKIGLLNEALELCAEISIPFPHTTAEDMAAQIRAAVGPMLQARGSARSSPAASTRRARRSSTRTT